MPDAQQDGRRPLSVAIVCKDNEATIGDTLASVAGLAAEVVAVDSGSTDATIGILESHGARVIRHEWLGHVRTKQMALEACGQPWALCLDSDESLTPGLRASIEAALGADPAVDGFEVNRKVCWNGVWLHHAWQPEWRLRLVRAGRAGWRGHDPHDALRLVDPNAKPGRLAGDLRHDAFGSIAEHLEAQARYAAIAAESLSAAGARGSVWRLLASPPAAWAKQAIGKRAFLDGWRGWVAASSVAAASLMKHAALLERTRGGRRDDP